MAGARGDDRPGAAELREREREALLVRGRRRLRQRGGCCSGDVIMSITIRPPIRGVVVAADDLRVVLTDDGSLVWSAWQPSAAERRSSPPSGRSRRPTTGSCAGRRRRRRDPAQPLARQSRESRRARAGRPRGAGRDRQAARADRRPAGPEAPDRRSAGAAHPARRTRRSIVVGEQSAANGELPVAPAVIGEVLRPGHDILIDDGLVRLCRQEVAARPRTLPRRRRRRGEVAQGRQPAGRPGADPVADEEGSRRSRLRARPWASTSSRSRSCAQPPTSATCRRSSASTARRPA